MVKERKVIAKKRNKKLLQGLLERGYKLRQKFPSKYSLKKGIYSSFSPLKTKKHVTRIYKNNPRM